MTAAFTYLSIPSGNKFSLIAILVVLIWTTFSVSGLVDLWAGLSQRHWFLRMMVVVGFITLPLMVSAYELVLIFLFQSALTTLPLLIYCRFRRRNVPESSREDETIAVCKAQYALRDMFLLTVLVAALSAITVRIPEKTWEEWRSAIGIAAIASPVTIVGAWIALSCRRWWLRLAILLVFLPTVSTVLFLGCAQAGGLLTGKTAAKRAWVRRTANGAVVVLLLSLLFPPALATHILFTPRPIPLERLLPNPNGLEDLIRMGKVLEYVDVPEELGDPDALAFFVHQHCQTLDEAHATLQRPCQLSLRYDQSDLAAEVLPIRYLAKGFVAEGMLAQLENKPSEAVRAFSDVFRVGAVIHREGIALDAFLGWAFDHYGISGIAVIRSTLTQDQCRVLIVSLQRTADQWEPLGETVARELAWQNRAIPWLIRLLLKISGAVDGQPVEASLDLGKKIHDAKFRLLLMELALQWHRLEHGRNPATLDALVPKYLPAVPQDPFSGKVLVYRLTPQGCLLYSVGPDGKDDGGKPYSYDDGSGDLVLDEPKEDKETPAATAAKGTEEN